MFERVRCKMICQSKRQQGSGWFVQLQAVWEGTAADGSAACKENASFAKATPSATFGIYIENEPAADFYEEGKCYYVDSSPAGDKLMYSEGWAYDYESGKYRHPETGELKEFADGPLQDQITRNQREAQERQALVTETD